MASVAVMLDRMSEWIDRSNPGVKVMRVKVTRAAAMDAGARPEKRGGPLFYKGRHVIYIKTKENGDKIWVEE